MGKKSVHAFSAGTAKHAARQHTESPVVREIESQAGVIICKRCRALHHDKRWYAADAIKQPQIYSHVHQGLCPGCHSVENKICNGEVILEGRLLEKMRTTVHGLIANVEDKCWHDNPSSRILSFNDLGDRIEVTTTTEWLATRIGKEVRKALKGKLQIEHFPEESFARVRWVSP